MQQLFLNLIGNALKFHRPDEPPVVKVYTRRATGQLTARPSAAAPGLDEDDCESESMVEIVVADNGIGFDEKYLDRIFQPFQRLHAQHEYSGSGMGLAICRKIVERHHGSLTAQSQPGKGTDFIVTLPLKQDENP
jgi:signal transduction histidine kinase